jgi:hypothetical protein
MTPRIGPGSRALGVLGTEQRRDARQSVSDKRALDRIAIRMSPRADDHLTSAISSAIKTSIALATENARTTPYVERHAKIVDVTNAERGPHARNVRRVL